MDNDKYREILRQDYFHDIERLEILKDLCEEHHIKLSDLLLAHGSKSRRYKICLGVSTGRNE